MQNMNQPPLFSVCLSHVLFSSTSSRFLKWSPKNMSSSCSVSVYLFSSSHWYKLYPLPSSREQQILFLAYHGITCGVVSDLAIVCLVWFNKKITLTGKRRMFHYKRQHSPKTGGRSDDTLENGLQCVLCLVWHMQSEKRAKFNIWMGKKATLFSF